MTNPPLPDDELASALVDGLGDDQERARLASDPALAARVEQLRAVRQAVATSTAGRSPIGRGPGAGHRRGAGRGRPRRRSRRTSPAHELGAVARHRSTSTPGATVAQAWLPAAAAAAVVAVARSRRLRGAP